MATKPSDLLNVDTATSRRSLGFSLKISSKWLWKKDIEQALTSPALVANGGFFRMIFRNGKLSFERINKRLRGQIRVKAGRKSDPSAGIIDSQSVKIVANIGFSGFDGAKKVNGRKRHIVTDTLGLLLTVVVHEASLSDRESAETVLVNVRTRFKRIKTIFVDQGYTGKLIERVRVSLRMTIEIIKRNEMRVFHILPRRWVVERTY